MKTTLLLLTTLICAMLNAQGLPPDIAALTFQSPIEITLGGTYSGNYKSDDGRPAIIINTTEPVIIEQAVLAGNGDEVVKMYGNTSVIIRNSKIYGLQPFNPLHQWPRAVNNYNATMFRFENNYMQHTGGILIDRWDGKNAQQNLVIRFNKGLNCDKRRGNGAPGDHRAWIQLNTVRGLINSSILWNEFINEPGNSWVEDNINLYNSSGTAASPLRIGNNFIQGAYPIPVGAAFTGSGITVDGSAADGGTFAGTSAYILASGNYIVSTANAGMNIAIGHHIKFSRNTIISCGRTPDGDNIQTWAGTCIFNGSSLPTSVFFANEISGNEIGFHSEGNGFPFQHRQDEMDNRAVNLMPSGKNVYLPNPVTRDMETAAHDKWKLQLAAIRQGDAAGL